MSEGVFKKTELVGTSSKSYQDAIEKAVGRAQKTIRNLSWFEVKELRGGLHNGKIEFQAVLSLAFKLEEA
ncbi:MAG: dodecin domain-containing protein [Candidatus Riflebacteria bacterium]|nr:dodecin domain-containing protein [Candidatus Riflebacteria bacterium]